MEKAKQSLEGQRILVIDDSEDIVIIVRFMMEREGAVVQTIGDGKEAEEHIGREAPPDLVVLDVMLPYVDGHQLLKKIRATGTWKDVPVIMLSAKGGQKDIVRGFDEGGDDYLPKPFSTEELLVRVRRLLRRDARN